MKQYHHISSEERFYIYQAIREGRTQQFIAESLTVIPQPSVEISNEIRWTMKTNSTLCGLIIIGLTGSNYPIKKIS